MEVDFKDFSILRKGRKHLHCLLGQKKARVLINESVKSLSEGEDVRLLIIDRSTINEFGSNHLYEPVCIVPKINKNPLRSILGGHVVLQSVPKHMKSTKKEVQ